MQLTLDQHWTEKLARLPETGMGYQQVRVKLKIGRTIENALVFNASVLEVAETIPPFRSEDITEIELTPNSAG
jgi:hypothetical protein